MRIKIKLSPENIEMINRENRSGEKIYNFIKFSGHKQAEFEVFKNTDKAINYIDSIINKLLIEIKEEDKMLLKGFGDRDIRAFCDSKVKLLTEIKDLLK